MDFLAILGTILMLYGRLRVRSGFDGTDILAPTGTNNIKSLCVDCYAYLNTGSSRCG